MGDCVWIEVYQIKNQIEKYGKHKANLLRYINRAFGFAVLVKNDSVMMEDCVGKESE